MVATLRFLSRALTYRQRYILALTRTTSGALSLFASSIILYKIYLRYKEHKSNTDRGFNTYFRMISSISILDILHSFWAALSVLPVPSSTGGVFAHGTVATCSSQAVFVQLIPTIVLYMATLNTYFMLKIRYNIKDSAIEKHYECWLHGIPIAFWLVTGCTGLALKVFGPLTLPELGCWIGSYPNTCVYTDTCTRGFKVDEYHDWYVWSFGYFWLFVCVLVVVVNSILIYTAIRKQEQRNDRYFAAKLQHERSSVCLTNKARFGSVPELSLPDFEFVYAESHLLEADAMSETEDEGALALPVLSETGESPCNEEHQDSLEFGEKPNSQQIFALDCTQNVSFSDKLGRSDRGPNRKHQTQINARRVKQSRTAAIQSSCYIVSALFTAVWTFLPWVGLKLMVKAPTRLFLATMVNTVTPSQGLFNLFIFVRLQYVHLRETKKDWSRFRCCKHCLSSPA
jgi:hypothetical protein